MKPSKLLLVCVLVSIAQHIQSQDGKSNMTLNGYLKYMHTTIVPAYDSTMITDNFLHNRLNYTWYLSENLTFKTSMRNRFFWGELVRDIPFIYSNLGDDTGYFDLSILWSNGTSTALHSVFDRMNLTYQNDKLEIIAGRQRVNWGTALIWNPNDIFNSYSFFDFDYEERPGTDAVQFNYYTGSTSSVSMVYALADDLEQSTLAAKYKFNKNTYDIQFIGGYQREFFVVGGGWAGDIKGAGFKGEGTYFIPKEDKVEETQFVGTVEFDYTMSNGIYLQTAYLFNSGGLNVENGNYSAFYLDRSLSVQTLSPAMHNLFFQVSGALSPILSAALASMINPKDGSLFIGPNVSWSVVENFDFLIAAQLFRGDRMTLYGDGGSLIFGRFKYSF
ncbi:MAG: hypothetical protein ABJF04_25310 [Reichenbachiella sp.]|uniref:hypothetical protein n=1 Tax=Reichenbachiella sp. TaxID=2184521 RepID=UPI003267C585